MCTKRSRTLLLSCVLLASCGQLASTDQSLQSLEEEEPLKPVPGNEVDAKEFLKEFNTYRSRFNLPPVKYSYKLSVDAQQNNNLQLRRGLGHHYMGNAHAQNSAVGYPDIKSVMNGWHHSSGHRVNMQNSRWNCMGIHKKGRYWTQNFRSNQSDCE